MEVVHARCCGLDIHKKLIVACAITPDHSGQPRRQVRTFGTMTDELLALADWLEGCGVTHVAMESTGVYWKPLWNLMEDRFTLLLVNVYWLVLTFSMAALSAGWKRRVSLVGEKLALIGPAPA